MQNGDEASPIISPVGRGQLVKMPKHVTLEPYVRVKERVERNK